MSDKPWKTTVGWEPILVPSRTLPWKGRLAGVLADLDVERAIRYSPQPKTKCNIYFTDIVRNMQIPAPEHWMTSGGDPAKVGRGIELTANRMFLWFRDHGGRYGWWKADEGTACSAAERGHVVAAIWQSDGRREPGHVALVLGERDGVTRITQAGGENFRDCALSAGFGKRACQFWIQADRESNEDRHHT